MLLAVACFMAWNAGASSLAAADGRLVQVKGAVQIKKQGKADWKKAAANMALAEGDQIKTDEKSVAVIAGPGDLRIKVMPLTAMTVSFSGKGPQTELSRGSVYIRESANMEKDNGPAFTIKTPMAICGVRGTFFNVDVTETDSSIAVFEGAVEVKGDAAPDEPVLVDAHKRTTVAKGQKPTEPALIPEDEEIRLKSNFTDKEYQGVIHEIGVRMSPADATFTNMQITVTRLGKQLETPVRLEIRLTGEASFENGEQTMIVTTDDKGVASVNVNSPGKFGTQVSLLVD